MTSKELRQKYLDFFKAKEHAIISSASLIPDNDPSTIFAGSGMQPMVPYLLGEKHPSGQRIVDSQKCFRAQDIEEIGDNRHTTFFEMLGNWSLGDYFKKEQLAWIFEFLIKEINLDPKNLYFTVFRGNKELNIPRDNEAVDILKEEFKKAGIEAKAVDFPENDGLQGGRIFYYDETKNWWSRSGLPTNMPSGEPGGPDSEIFWDFGAKRQIHENSPFKNKPCHLNCDCGRFLEIGNNVFMQYLKTERGFKLLPKGNIDFGGGLERITAITDNNPDIFQTDLFINLIFKIEKLSDKKYGASLEITKAMRIIADHLKAATFIMGDDQGLAPSNVNQGYVVRRLIRRAIRYGRQLEIKEQSWTKQIAKVVAHDYQEIYPELRRNIDKVVELLKEEEAKFGKTLELGIKKFQSQISNLKSQNQISNFKTFPSEIAFDLFQTYGFPLEITQELAREHGYEVDTGGFNEELKKHQELSRTASAGMFKGGLADDSEAVVKYHTAAHLLLAALRKIFGDQVIQRGSNITAERLRFDFAHKEKMTDEEKQQVETLVNQTIKQNLPVVCEEMSLEEAKAKGARGIFETKYGERVKIYTIGDEKLYFSKEICGGPHIENTGILGHFKILKEESSSADVRRIKAILE